MDGVLDPEDPSVGSMALCTCLRRVFENSVDRISGTAERDASRLS